MRFLDLARYGDVWGAILTAIGIACLFVNRGDLPQQRTAHRIFRIVLILSAINFTLAGMSGPYRMLQRTSPTLNNFLIRWLIASIFFVPAGPIAETAWMRSTRSPEKTKALTTDFALAFAYAVTVAGTLAIAVMSQE